MNTNNQIHDNQNQLTIMAGHDFIDLGLPSGTLWATCNVGASKPEEYGGYYAWGETEEKEEYTSGKSLTYGKSLSDIAGTEYDVAHVKWGGGWKMPTKTQMDELINPNYCICTWTARNGINGYEVKSKMNGNSIFLPAAGSRYASFHYGVGSEGFLWGSTPYEKDTQFAAFLRFDDGDSIYCFWHGRDFGWSVRPVLNPSVLKTQIETMIIL